METDTERKVRDLKAAIKTENRQWIKENLKRQLNETVKALAERDYQEKVRRFAGNAY